MKILKENLIKITLWKHTLWYFQQFLQKIAILLLKWLNSEYNIGILCIVLAWIVRQKLNLFFEVPKSSNLKKIEMSCGN